MQGHPTPTALIVPFTALASLTGRLVTGWLLKRFDAVGIGAVLLGIAALGTLILSAEAVRDFILAFLDGDLIPAVICWQSPSRLSFVIDGAHRLSAVIAWLSDDYGQGSLSNKFYGEQIPDQQRKIHLKTKSMVDKAVGGTHANIKEETKNPGAFPQLSDRAKALSYSTIPLLWIKGPEWKKAERAFFTINRSAVEIDPTELQILRTRFAPAAISGRAIVRNATGHSYWHTFSKDNQANLVEDAQHINSLLYSPPLVEPIKSIEALPISLSCWTNASQVTKGHRSSTRSPKMCASLSWLRVRFKSLVAERLYWRGGLGTVGHAPIRSNPRR